MAQSRKKVDFEKNLESLETIVRQLEEGELSLEQSLKIFEKGVNLTRDCQAALVAAEQRVQILTDRDNGAETEDFSPGTKLE